MVQCKDVFKSVEIYMKRPKKRKQGVKDRIFYILKDTQLASGAIKEVIQKV